MIICCFQIVFYIIRDNYWLQLISSQLCFQRTCLHPFLQTTNWRKYLANSCMIKLGKKQNHFFVANMKKLKLGLSEMYFVVCVFKFKLFIKLTIINVLFSDNCQIFYRKLFFSCFRRNGYVSHFRTVKCNIAPSTATLSLWVLSLVFEIEC